MKKLVIKKMEESLLPNLSENIVEDFYLTPDYFEKELNTKYGQVFLFNQNLPNQLILDFIINQRFLMVCILLEQVPSRSRCTRSTIFSKSLRQNFVMEKKSFLSIYAKSFNWAGFFFQKKLI